MWSYRRMLKVRCGFRYLYSGGLLCSTYHTVPQMAKWMQIRLHTLEPSLLVAAPVWPECFRHFSIPCGISAYPQPFRRAQWMQTGLMPAAVRQQRLGVCFYSWSRAAVIQFAAYYICTNPENGQSGYNQVCFQNTNRPQQLVQSLAVRCGCIQFTAHYHTHRP